MRHIGDRIKLLGVSDEAAAFGVKAAGMLGQLPYQNSDGTPSRHAQRIFEDMSDKARKETLLGLIGGLSLNDQVILLLATLDQSKIPGLLDAQRLEVEKRVEHRLFIEQTRTEALNNGVINLESLPPRTTIQLDLYPVNAFDNADDWEELVQTNGSQPVWRMKLNANEDQTFRLLHMKLGSYNRLPTTPIYDLPQIGSSLYLGSLENAVESGISQVIYFGGEIVYNHGDDTSRSVIAVQETALALGGAWMNGEQLFHPTAVSTPHPPSSPR